MRGVVVDRAALVALQRVEEPLEGRAVEHVLAGMDFVGDVDAGVVEGVEDRLPAPRQFLERGLDQARRRAAARDRRRARRARRRSVACARQAEMLRGLAPPSSSGRPPISGARAGALHLGRRESVERLVVGRIDRDELALQMGRKLGDREAVALGDARRSRRNRSSTPPPWRDRTAGRPRSESARPCSRATPPIRRSRRRN